MTLPISVVVPAYNRADLLPETLNSILHQDMPPAEVIVVDDGSTDSTRQVVESYPPPVRYIGIQNSGVCRARNVGAQAATCEWLAFCDSDDLWRPDKLARQVELIQAAPDAEFQFTDFVHVVDGKWLPDNKFSQVDDAYWSPARLILDPYQWVFTEPIYSRVLRFQCVFQSGLLMTRDFFFRIGGFDESFGRTKSEDLEFVLRCISHAPVAALALPVVGIRKHKGNFSAQQTTVLLGEIAILRHAMAHHQAAQSCLPVLLDEIVCRSASAADGLFTAGDLPAFRQVVKDVPFRRRSARLIGKSAIAALPHPLDVRLRSRFVS